MSILLWLASMFVVARRLRNGTTALVPLILGCLAAVMSVQFVVGALETRASIALMNPADRAIVLAAGISTGLNSVV